MESQKRITKSQLLEMVRKEVEIQERKKLLENRISELNHEIYIISEGESGKKKKKDEDDIEEGWLKNAGQAISRGVAGASGVFQGMKQNYQKGSDQKSIEQITSDIKEKEQELAQLKKNFEFITRKPYNAKNSQNAVAAPRNLQGVKKSVPKKQNAKPATTQQAQPAVQQTQPATKKTQPAAKKTQPVAKKAPAKQTANVIPGKQGRGAKKAAE